MNTDFTIRAHGQIQKTMCSSFFKEEGAEAIFQVLKRGLENISFGEYLKRYIYRKAEISLPFDQVDLQEYQEIIICSFKDNHTPKSFEPTTSKLSVLAHNWLTQKLVKRKVVFLLGFGLSMTVSDVNKFLGQGLKEREIYPKDPFEVICWYCYKNAYSYSKFEDLWNKYEALQKDNAAYPVFLDKHTVNVKTQMLAIENEDMLISYLKWLKSCQKGTQSVTCREWFDKLYAESRKQIAMYFNSYEITEEIRSSGKSERKFFTPDDITAGDIEKVIYSAVPIDEQGNLFPEKKCALYEQIGGKRFGRKRINEILNARVEINRNDLITLYFFVLAKKMEDDYGAVEERAKYFMKSINRILEDCQMWPLYITNPYESFIYLCMQTDDPLETYAQVWEMAYSSNK